MNYVRLLPVIGILGILLISSTYASGHGNGDHMTDPEHMQPDRPKEGPSFDQRGFMGNSENFNITGNISVSDAIHLELSVSPSLEMQEHMTNHPNGMHNDMMGEDMDMNDFTNTISVSLTKLVEFNDKTENGLTTDDVIISTYALNTSNLNDIIQQNDNGTDTYTINSKDGVFAMSVVVNVTDNLPTNWKWSLLINYNFQSNSSKLAMIHEITTSRGNMMENHNNDLPHDFSNMKMRDNNSHIPLFMRWAPTASVDGSYKNIIPSSIYGQLALSLDQGKVIEYDPSIGVDINDLDNLDQEINAFFASGVNSFMDNIFSPTSFGLILTLGIISAILVVSFKFKNKN